MLPENRHFRVLVVLASIALSSACGSNPSAGTGSDVGGGDGGLDATNDGGLLDGSGDPGDVADNTDARDVVDAIDTEGDDASANDASDADADASVEFCTSDDDCAIGLCLQIDPGADEGVCAQQCIDDQSCPQGSTCRRYVNSGGDAVSVCVPDDLCIDADSDRFGFGNGCLGPDCDDSSSLINLGADEMCDGFDNDCDEEVDESPVDGGDACGTGLPGQCAAGSTTCADGILSCLPISGQADELCDGIDNDCDGYIDNGNPGGGATCGTGLPGPCSVGARACDEGSVVCEQTVFASDETCDGTDNDCDGSTDEGFAGEGVDCDTGLLGACAAGRLTCGGGESFCVQAVFPSAEVCDGVDNDCNGQIDEGEPGAGVLCSTGLPGACSTGTTACVEGNIECQATSSPSAELCDFVDNDCDGNVDNGNPGSGAACSTGVPGLCNIGRTSCTEAGLICEQTVFSATDVCDDLDNDCDGATDENNPGGGAPCSTGSAGDCAAGTMTCSGGSLVCAANFGPTTEVCDGRDNNCDASTDEGNPGGGSACATGIPGTCGQGTLACTGSGLQCLSNSAPATEVCDLLDNNCNGATDEGNPGGGFACDTGTPGVCAAGTTVCLSGGINCAQNIAGTGEICDGLDNNCNGTVDDGCPTGLSLAGGTSSPQYGGGGGTAFSQSCAAGSAIVGFQIRAGSEIDALGHYCAPVTISESRAATPYTYPITTGTVQAMSFFGGGGGTYYTQQCPAGQVVIGIEGRAASRTDRWQWVCGSLRASGSPGTYSVVRTSQGSSSAFGGTGGDFFSFTCPDNQIATRFFGRAGSRIDAVGIQCSIPTLSVR